MMSFIPVKEKQQEHTGRIIAYITVLHIFQFRQSDTQIGVSETERAGEGGEIKGP